MPNLLSDTTPSPDGPTATLAATDRPVGRSSFRTPLGRDGGLRQFLSAKYARLSQELAKFGAVGVIALAIEISVFNACRLSGVGPMLAHVISTIIAATAAFAGNRYWTWRNRPRTGLRREYLLYFFFNAIGLMIGLGCLLISRDVLGQVWPTVFHTVLADNVAAKGVGMALATLFRFWAYRRWVFPETPNTFEDVHVTLPELPVLEVDKALGVANSTVGVSQ